MTAHLRRGMLATARAAVPDLARPVGDFLVAHVAGGGGFTGRDEGADLYYTVFGLHCARTVGMELPLATFADRLELFDVGEELDPVHLCCLIRAWAELGELSGGEIAPDAATAAGLLESLRAFRCDGGFPHAADDEPSVYGCFLAAGAFQDLGRPIERPPELLATLAGMANPDGSYSNSPSLPVGLVPPTAAAVVLRRALGDRRTGPARDYLLSVVDDAGGFGVMPGMEADLLSTGVALHALSVAQADLTSLEEPTRRWVLARQDASGGFQGPDGVPDVEYTWYGLLSLGALRSRAS